MINKIAGLIFVTILILPQTVNFVYASDLITELQKEMHSDAASKSFHAIKDGTIKDCISSCQSEKRSCLMDAKNLAEKRHFTKSYFSCIKSCSSSR
jgi:hypothetical protein